MKTITNILNNIDSSNHKFDNSVFKTWAATPATQKGLIGEKIITELLEDKGHKVSARVSKEHDIVVDGKYVEVKTAFLKRDQDVFSFYGYDATEDPHHWMLQLVYPDMIVVMQMDRKAMASIYLGKTRKNTMFTVNYDMLKDAGGKLVVAKEFKNVA